MEDLDEGREWTVAFLLATRRGRIVPSWLLGLVPCLWACPGQTPASTRWGGLLHSLARRLSLVICQVLCPACHGVGTHSRFLWAPEWAPQPPAPPSLHSCGPVGLPSPTLCCLEPSGVPLGQSPDPFRWFPRPLSALPHPQAWHPWLQLSRSWPPSCPCPLSPGLCAPPSDLR